jgi:hypothetical protein
MGASRSMETEDDRTQEALREAARLLTTFMESRERFLVTNDSMQVLVDEFARRIQQREAVGHEVAFLRAWRRNVANVRDSALAEGRANAPGLRVDFRNVPVLTENQARLISGLCPERPKF